MEDRPTLYRRGVCTCAIGHTRYSATRHCLQQIATAGQAGNVDVETSGNTPTERRADITPASHWAGYCFSVSLRTCCFNLRFRVFCHALKANRRTPQSGVPSRRFPIPHSLSAPSTLHSVHRTLLHRVREDRVSIETPPILSELLPGSSQYLQACAETGPTIRPRPFTFRSFLIHNSCKKVGLAFDST